MGTKSCSKHRRIFRDFPNVGGLKSQMIHGPIEVGQNSGALPGRKNDMTRYLRNHPNSHHFNSEI